MVLLIFDGLQFYIGSTENINRKSHCASQMQPLACCNDIVLLKNFCLVRDDAVGIVLVTDAISAMGLRSGVHHLGSQLVEVRNKCAVLAGTDTLCGR